jgi:hypothetical protein
MTSGTKPLSFSETKLILLEGLPGTGKSTAAEALCERLRGSGYNCQWFHEDEPRHPLSHEGLKMGEDVASYRDVLADRWRTFVAAAHGQEAVTILDARLLQNALLPQVRQGLERGEILESLLRLAKICEPLSPQLIYLRSNDYPSRLKSILQARGADWSRFMIQRDEASALAQRRGLLGFDALFGVLTQASAVQERFLSQVPMCIHQVEIENGWPTSETLYEMLYRPTVP